MKYLEIYNLKNNVYKINLTFTKINLKNRNKKTEIKKQKQKNRNKKTEIKWVGGKIKNFEF